MANLPEIPAWDSGIHQLEESDRAKAGPGGILNLQANQLANRTQWLKSNLLSIPDYREYTFYISSTDPDGTISGLAGTPVGKIFRVAQGSNSDSSFIYYLNNAGLAQEIAKAPGQGAIESILALISDLGLRVSPLQASPDALFDIVSRNG
ncbi:TPA: CotH kinase family protein, partial [Klebsiella oxytoca]